MGALLKKLSGGIAVQILTSGSNFIVGFLLIRLTIDAQYGYFVLINTAVLLSTNLQGTFFQPPMLIRLARADQSARADLIGGLYRVQNRLVPFIAIPAALFATALYVTGHLNAELLTVVGAGTIAVMTALHREFFRMVLFSYRQANLVLGADVVYCILLIAGVGFATQTAYPAAVAALAMAVAGLVGRWLLARKLWHYEPWNRAASAGVLREIAGQGAWSAFGGGSHWLFNQGYSYLVAGTLSISAVAALAATRLLLSPVTLLSTGLGFFMLPTVSSWTHSHPANTVLRRLTLFAVGLAGVVCIYLLVMWLARDWIFVHVLKKAFDERDSLLLLWSLVAMVTLFRDQFMYFLTMRGRLRLTSSVTFVSALVSLTIGVVAMRYVGVIGAPAGILVGELLNVIGMIVFSVREARLRPYTSAVPA